MRTSPFSERLPIVMGRLELFKSKKLKNWRKRKKRGQGRRQEEETSERIHRNMKTIRTKMKKENEID